MKWAQWKARLNILICPPSPSHFFQKKKKKKSENSRLCLLLKATVIKCEMVPFCLMPFPLKNILCDIQDELKPRSIPFPTDHMIGPWPAFFTDDDWTSPFQCRCNLKGEFGSSHQFACLMFCILENSLQKSCFHLSTSSCALLLPPYPPVQHCRGDEEKNESVFPPDQYSNVDHSSNT